ncbi:hypothetical protein SDC9_15254 [bioreactor metagenome]|uniref:Prokaryotic membrane lipoprotein lipid attachment site profile n=2 Tax=root TaxID=1 RepID=A0A098B6B8_DESHA|nr:hypothetical protein [Desulfitobacterium hafniense]MEA5024003.1 hypothetical protein [Desulfitobacterium hafniense]CDX03421.1 Prokaryotic membrane lipoprotein lipid attachment site profile [Desulfitobacterium hafniense]
MLRKLSMGLIIAVLIFGIGGCGNTNKNQPQNPAAEQQQNENVKSEYLTPIPEGTPIGESNLKLSEQIMAQKDVLGTQIYEQQGITYGDITFNAGVDKAYANQLLGELLAQMKINYSGMPLTVQGISDGQVIDSINFKP